MKSWKAALLQAMKIQLHEIIESLDEEEVGVFDLQVIRTNTNDDESIVVKTDGVTLVQLANDEVQVEATYNNVKRYKGGN